MKSRNTKIIIMALVLLFCSINVAEAFIILDSGDCERPRMNDLGEIVWRKKLGEDNYAIFSNIRGQISSGKGIFSDPDINNEGEIVWRFGTGGSGDNGVESNIRGILFNSPGETDPYVDTIRINNEGEILCSRHLGTYLWTTERDDDIPVFSCWFARECEINDHGEIVFQGYHGNTGNNFDIYSTVRGAITNNSYLVRDPDINNNGEIVWSQENEIWSNLRGFIGYGMFPSINNLGEIVYSSLVDYDSEIFSNIRGQLTFNNVDDKKPQINDLGQIVWINDRENIAFIPEPATLFLLGLGVFLLRKRR